MPTLWPCNEKLKQHVWKWIWRWIWRWMCYSGWYYYCCDYFILFQLMKRKHRIIESIIFFVVMGVYFLNRFYLKRLAIPGFAGYFLKCYFNDFLGGISILAYLSLVFSYSQYDTIDFSRPICAFIVTSSCGVFWEFIFPPIFHHGTSDPLDILAYSLGGLFYSAIQIIIKERQGA